MDYKGTRVLVLDGFGRQQASILRQLHDLGCIITTVNDSKLDVGYASRYPHKRIVEHGIRDDEALYERIIKQELATGNYDVVFPMLFHYGQYVGHCESHNGSQSSLSESL